MVTWMESVSNLCSRRKCSINCFSIKEISIFDLATQFSPLYLEYINRWYTAQFKVKPRGDFDLININEY